MIEVITTIDVRAGRILLFPKGTILKVYDILPDKCALVEIFESKSLLFSNEYEIYNPSLENK